MHIAVIACVMLLIPLAGVILLEHINAQKACNSSIFCEGPVLDAIQRSQIFLDPKRFVDMPTKYPPAQVTDINCFIELFRYLNLSSN